MGKDLVAVARAVDFAARKRRPAAEGRGRGAVRQPDWDWKRPSGYFEWAGQVADGCRGVNPVLERGFDEAHARGLAALEAAR